MRKRTIYKDLFLTFLSDHFSSLLAICFLETAEALAMQVSQENLDKGLIYPPFANIRKISAQIASKVAAKAYELGRGTS